MKVLVVFAHPLPDSFCSATLDCVLGALRSYSHDIDLLDLYAEGFDAVLSREAHAHHLDGPETKPEINGYARQLVEAEWLVLIYPTWLGGPPALLKGWIDRVWVQGIAFSFAPGQKRIKKLLTRLRRFDVVTTYGSSRLINMIEGEPGKRMLMRGLRTLFPVRCKTRWLACYKMDRNSKEDRQAFLARAERAFSLPSS